VTADDAESPGPGTTPSAGVPTCFRHPGRETYVSCVRCGRPACPDCLRSAAVGQQCVDCVRAGNRGTRPVSAVFGGRAVSGAVVTWALVAINVVLYLIELARPGLGYDLGMIGLGRFTSGGPLQGVAEGQWYRLITSAFLPPPGGGLGPLDIIFNMWALILVGPALERLLGHARYLTVYLVSALGGSVALYVLVPYELALGASGAIFGLFGAWFVVARRLRLDSRWIVTLVVLNLVIGFVVPNIAWQAHLGGLLAGGLLTAAYAYAPRENRALIQVGATVAVVGVLILAVLVRDHQVAQVAAATLG
jgi:membrane associated rhomboid family serine protease